MRVLVLDGHTTQALASVRSLGRAGCTVFVASDQRAPLASWSRYCSGLFHLSGATRDALAALRERAAVTGVQIVLPLTERSCRICNAEAESWRALGITLGSVPDDIRILATDKALTIERAHACGIRVPPTRQAHSIERFHAAAEELDLPCVIRPRFGSSRADGASAPVPGIAWVDDPDAIASCVLERRQGDYWPLIQRYVPGRECMVSVLCDRGRVVRWFAYERLRDVRPSRSGSSLRRSTAIDARLVDPIERFMRHVEWHGPATLEFRDNGHEFPWFIEMDARFRGSLQLAVAAGSDVVVQWIRLLSGRAAGPATAYRENVTMRWIRGDVNRFRQILRGAPRGYPEAFPARRNGLRELLGPQPRGTRVETWNRDDPAPAVAEWIHGLGDLLRWRPRVAEPV